ncbi:hypothetical protein HRR83_005354 [Exophiala dermatitidis]|nr:hypothetical protein HRR74_005207 [Exophiala dermatitidis]KAJ4571553.1 hypothetical protein HRR81_005584 [Exophiala dermatitidis]KAJ4585750.1 hypothetical protein HRR82_002806 [Exophiala dermatitidis]KAJ4595714.1 hypothetical protein HRR83_005354 [Exophiala dermatitidis]KAJ4612927.1 hypothetical protein HRR85_004494 [Exophiala dermatitidis]
MVDGQQKDGGVPSKQHQASSTIFNPCVRRVHRPWHWRSQLPDLCAVGAFFKLSQHPPPITRDPTVAVSQQHSNLFDDPYETYEPQPGPSPQRLQPDPTPILQRPPASSGSSPGHSLRRTPRLPDIRAGREIESPPQQPSRPQATPDRPPASPDDSESSSPEFFQRLVHDDSYWPQRTTHISRGTHEAILYALEAIRKGSGVNPKPLTADLLEEEARMSDLTGGYVPGTVGASGRTQNGGASRATAAAGTGPTPTEPPRYRTPTDVMRERRAREARKAEEAAARLRQEEERRVAQEEDVVGVGAESSRRASGRPGPQSYNIGGPSTQVPDPSTRRQENVPPTQTGPSRPSAAYSRPVQAAGKDAPITAAQQRNRTEAYEQLNIPATAKPVAQAEPVSRPPRQSQPPPLAGGQPAGQAASQARPAPAQPPAAGGRRGFPGAFERWEDLSSHWEGIVSSFIHRLENNADELAGKPIERQMARQIEDLSAAGANLFHAVVELQRLRASSERKFQRWFFETRHEQEQARERLAELERQLRVEREARTQSSVSIETARAEKARAEELVKEMRRELQISKEEARRAWEELGRREQEERERTISLRSGEPTLIGGVQVVPMQGLPSRQVSSAQRPQTRDGPTAGAGPSTMSGQQHQQQQQQMHGSQRPLSRGQTTTTSLDSPGEESRQFSYQPDAGNSPTVTDPFTDASRPREHQQPQLRHEPDTQFYTISPPRPTQPQTSAAAIAAARAAPSGGVPGPSPGRGPHDPRFYHQATVGAPVRSGTGDTEQSYIPSTGSIVSEEEYHINPDGSYRRDAQGRRIPYRQPLGGNQQPMRVGEEAGHIDPRVQRRQGEQLHEYASSSDDDDHAADVERERMYAAQYRQGIPPSQPPPQHPPQPSSTTTTTSAGRGAMPPVLQGRRVDPTTTQYEYEEGDVEGEGEEEGREEYDPSSPPPPQSGGVGGSAPTATATTWENVRHRHPTRLSDIIEEQTAHTSPSRASHVSGTPGGLSSPPTTGPR